MGWDGRQAIYESEYEHAKSQRWKGKLSDPIVRLRWGG